MGVAGIIPPLSNVVDTARNMIPKGTNRRAEWPAFIRNIITTKRNKTAIAPTYMIKNMIAINSAFGVNVKSKPVALQNTSIKKITE